MKKIDKNKKSLIKIATATMVAIFSLASAFTGTIAWFTSSQKAEVTGMSFRVSVIHKAFAALSIHRCDLSLSTSTTLHFYSEPVVSIDSVGSTVTTGNVHMDNYSTLNQTQPVLFLFTMYENTYEDDVTITAKSDNAAFTSIITNENVAHFPFSSASSFRCASYTSNSFPFNNVVVSGLSSRTTFVQINGQNTPNYNQSIQLFDGTNHTTIKYVAVILDYYSEAIEYIKALDENRNYVDIAAGNNNSIDFYCDWTLEM